jgi:DNA replication protein DnaC
MERKNIFRRPQVPLFRIPNAKGNFMLGMTTACGENFKYIEPYDEVIKWMTDNHRSGLLLMGENGLGKSLICNYIVPTVMQHFFKKIVTCVSAIEMNKDIDRLKNVGYLSIDDIGTEGEHLLYGERRMALPEIADEAERCGHLLLLSTNLTLAEMEHKYGRRTVDRLLSLTHPIIFKGQSLRRRA